MTHNDSHLMALIAELKQSRNVMDQREVKTLQVIEELLKRIEKLENQAKMPVGVMPGTMQNPDWWRAILTGKSWGQ